ncbi:hypothetical protein DW655_00860 [Lachnospiraceae bacterium AM23-2LB]|nr:hypothetical protein DW655_00860 [Lachnospiraceae bacterium AM23-2LB]RJW01929.1 hypothetical protein DW887_11130 [Lachnospiraceae bacterium AM40-2BH]
MILIGSVMLFSCGAGGGYDMIYITRKDPAGSAWRFRQHNKSKFLKIPVCPGSGTFQNERK